MPVIGHWTMVQKNFFRLFEKWSLATFQLRDHFPFNCSFKLVIWLTCIKCYAFAIWKQGCPGGGGLYKCEEDMEHICQINGNIRILSSHGVRILLV